MMGICTHITEGRGVKEEAWVLAKDTFSHVALQGSGKTGYLFFNPLTPKSD